MQKVILYIAQSKDGFVADKNGGVDFLNSLPMGKEAEKKFCDFFTKVDVVIMGTTVYRQVNSELSPGNWPYKDKKSYVFTHNPNGETVKNEIVHFVSGDVKNVFETIKADAKGDIWIMGGADIAKQFHDAGLIDKYIITTVPTVLNQGLELFSSSIKLNELKKISQDKFEVFEEDIYSK